MKPNFLLSILTIIIAGSILAACSGQSADKASQLEKMKADYAALASEISKLEKEIQAENPSESKIKTKEVAVTEAATRSFNHYIQTQGVVEAEDNILVSAKTMGVITQVYVSEGQQVSKGQTLAQIDNTVIVSSIDEVKSGLELASTVFERQKNLWEQKIGTEIQFLQAKNNKEGLEKRLATLNEQLDMSKIKSPISGTVDAINVKAGENAGPGMPAFRVINTSDLKITANVSEAYAASVKLGDKVLVTVPDMNKTMEAKVTFAGRNIDTFSRTFPVEVKLPGVGDLRPNQSAVIKIVFFNEPDAICVPVNVVQEVNGEKVVYVAEQSEGQTVARRKVVEVVGVYDNLAQLKTGIKVGDKVITFGYQGLNDGDFVKI